MRTLWAPRGHSGRVLDSRPRGRGFEFLRPHCVVSLSKNINPSLVLIQPRKTRPFITERLSMGRKESNQTNKTLWAQLFDPFYLSDAHVAWKYRRFLFISIFSLLNF